jgi:cell division protein FtsB
VRALLRRGLWLVAPLVAGALAWGAWRGVVEARRSGVELDALSARRDQLARAKEELRREVEALGREPVARERAARETLDVVAPGEVLVIVPEPATPRAP